MDLRSDPFGVRTLPLSDFVSRPLLLLFVTELNSGVVLLREGTRALLVFSSYKLPLELLVFDDGRSSFRVVKTFVSYGLNVSGRLSGGDALDFGVLDMVDGDFAVSDFLLLSIVLVDGLIVDESAPI